MEKVVLFIDYQNLSAVLNREGFQIDFVSLRDYLAEGRILTEVLCYIGLNSFETREGQEFYQSLKMSGFLVRFQEVQVDNSIQGGNTIQFALDVADYLYAARPDIVVIVTGDENYSALANWLRLQGVRVEVASTPNNISPELRGAANGFIDLTKVIEEIQIRKEVISDGSRDR